MRIFNEITKGYQKLILCAVIIENVSDFVAEWHEKYHLYANNEQAIFFSFWCKINFIFILMNCNEL